MNKQTGFLSIESKNIFTILKKWLYAEQDIVFRELLSNASDAIEKRATLSKAATESDEVKPEQESPAGNILVTLDSEGGRLIISDNGIGMTADEVDQYINQIAFSGATDFINQHQNDTTDTIIGHFGVGFYSAFMLTDHVTIETKSINEDAPPVRWDCKSDLSFDMKTGSRTEPGTDVILYLDSLSPYLQKPDQVFAIIRKYFAYLKTGIFLQAPGYNHTSINDTDPIWKRPTEAVNRADMMAFYKDTFNDISDPLFWIQFESADIGLRGVLFFRDLKNGTEELDGTIKVFNRGVYIGDNLLDIIPKYVNLQSGIIDCTDLPLIVSRSNIRNGSQQNGQLDERLALISETLTQEVTIALNDMFENNRTDYERFWPNLNAFVKYGILNDKIFASVMTRKVIFQDIYGQYRTIQEYVAQEGAKSKDLVLYVSDSVEQAHYITIFKRGHLNALLFDHVIDQPFMRRQELVHPSVRFARVDSCFEAFEAKITAAYDQSQIEALTTKIKLVLGDRINNMDLKIAPLEEESITALIVHDEKSRRMADMLEIYGVIKGSDQSAKELQSKSTFLVNLNNEILRFVIETEDQAQTEMILRQLFDLALMGQGAMSLEDVESFIARSESLILQYIKG